MGDGVESMASACGLGQGLLEDEKVMMKERLTIAINGIRSDKRIPTLDEAGIRTQVIDRILERLGWEIFDDSEFVREFAVPGGKVDYALLVNRSPKVFIEAKRPSEDLRHHEDQLVTYSAKRGVRLAVLTNGLNWWLYLPLKEGDFRQRRFCELDVSKLDSSETCDLLIKFLARENVFSGVAVENAEARLAQLQEARRVDKALPRAWEGLLDGPDGLLVDLINEKVKGLCGVEAEPERIKRFLVGLGKPVPAAIEFASRTASTEQEISQENVLREAQNLSNNPNKRKRPRTTIVGFTFCGQEFSVRSGTAALIALAEEINRRHRAEFDKVRTLSGWYSSEERFPSRPPSPIADSGWYVYTNIKTDTKIAKCNELVRLFGYRKEDLIIQVR